MNKEAFQAGFITGLADKGYTPDEFEGALEKSSLIGALGWALPAAAGAGALGLGLTRLLGRGAGQTAQSFTEPGERDVDIAKKEEELETYKRLIQEAKQRAAEQVSAQIPGTV